jgi:hypothetical protein
VFVVAVVAFVACPVAVVVFLFFGNYCFCFCFRSCTCSYCRFCFCCSMLRPGRCVFDFAFVLLLSSCNRLCSMFTVTSSHCTKGTRTTLENAGILFGRRSIMN